jgi:hypothetical protein
MRLIAKIERPAEALDEGDGAGAAATNPDEASPTALPGEEGAKVGAKQPGQEG